MATSVVGAEALRLEGDGQVSFPVRGLSPENARQLAVVWSTDGCATTMAPPAQLRSARIDVTDKSRPILRMALAELSLQLSEDSRARVEQTHQARVQSQVLATGQAQGQAPGSAPPRPSSAAAVQGWAVPYLVIDRGGGQLPIPVARLGRATEQGPGALLEGLAAKLAEADGGAERTRAAQAREDGRNRPYVVPQLSRRPIDVDLRQVDRRLATAAAIQLKDADDNRIEPAKDRPTAVFTLPANTRGAGVQRYSYEAATGARGGSRRSGLVVRARLQGVAIVLLSLALAGLLSSYVVVLASVAAHEAKVPVVAGEPTVFCLSRHVQHPSYGRGEFVRPLPAPLGFKAVERAGPIECRRLIDLAVDAKAPKGPHKAKVRAQAFVFAREADVIIEVHERPQLIGRDHMFCVPFSGRGSSAWIDLAEPAMTSPWGIGLAFAPPREALGVPDRWRVEYLDRASYPTRVRITVDREIPDRQPVEFQFRYISSQAIPPVPGQSVFESPLYSVKFFTRSDCAARPSVPTAQPLDPASPRPPQKSGMAPGTPPVAHAMPLRSTGGQQSGPVRAYDDKVRLPLDGGIVLPLSNDEWDRAEPLPQIAIVKQPAGGVATVVGPFIIFPKAQPGTTTDTIEYELRQRANVSRAKIDVAYEDICRPARNDRLLFLPSGSYLVDRTALRPPLVDFVDQLFLIGFAGVNADARSIQMSADICLQAAEQELDPVRPLIETNRPLDLAAAEREMRRDEYQRLHGRRGPLRYVSYDLAGALAEWRTKADGAKRYWMPTADQWLAGLAVGLAVGQATGLDERFRMLRESYLGGVHEWVDARSIRPTERFVLGPSYAEPNKWVDQLNTSSSRPPIGFRLAREP